MGKFTVLSMLSCSITIVLAVFWITLSSLSLSIRNDCLSYKSLTNDVSDYMWLIFYKQYILDESCVGAASLGTLTRTRTVFIFTIVSLLLALSNLITAILLMISMKVKSCKLYVEMATALYIFSYITSFIVDFIFAMHLGIDYMGITQAMNETKSGMAEKYWADALRISTFMVTLLATKGLAAPLINIAIIILMLAYMKKYVKAQSQVVPSPEREYQSRARNSAALYNLWNVFKVPTNTGLSTVSRAFTPGPSASVRGNVTVVTNTNLERASFSPIFPQRRAPITEFSRRLSRSTITSPVVPRSPIRVREDVPFNSNPEFEVASTSSAATAVQLRRQRLPSTDSEQSDELTFASPSRAPPSVYASEPITYIINADVDLSSTSSDDSQLLTVTEV